MKKIKADNFSEMREIGGFDETIIALDTCTSRQPLVCQAEIERYLTREVAEAIEEQALRDAGIEGPLRFLNGVLHLGIYRVRGDLLRDVWKKVAIPPYAYEVDSPCVYSEKSYF